MDNIEDNINGIDTEYIKYLMLYSDHKYPFVKAKADPGMTESVRGITRFMSKHGDTRKFDNKEAHRILLQEKHAREQFMLNKSLREDRDRYEEDFPQQAQINPQDGKSKDVLEDELAALKKQVMEKEAEIRARSSNAEIPKPDDRTMWNKLNVSPQKKTPSDDGIIERKLEDTGYTDKINNT